MVSLLNRKFGSYKKGRVNTMEYLIDSNTAKEIDSYTSNVIGIPSLVLMERAALEVTNVLVDTTTKQDRIIGICGSGNNGGDGIAIIRQLFVKGYQVAICFIGEEEKATYETRQQIDFAKKLGISFVSTQAIYEYNIIIDAIFGIGLSRPIEGDYARIIQQINDDRLDNGKKVIAIDVPSGIHSDTGKVMNVAIKADITVTFGYRKLGLVLYPGTEYAGEVSVKDIGFPLVALEEAFRSRQNEKATYFTYHNEDLGLLPFRPAYSNKGTFGKVLVVAGSEHMCGAAYFAAKAAYRTGAGLVYILTVKENKPIIQNLLPEAIILVNSEDIYTNSHKMKKLLVDIYDMDAIIIGSGLNIDELSKKTLSLVLEHTKAPTIVDADGINIITQMLPGNEENGNYFNRLKRLDELLPRDTILTPHMKEFSRLLDVNIKALLDSIIDTVSDCAHKSNLIFVVKDARTTVAKNEKCYINSSGNNGMATAGSGDVLTGIIAGLIAQGVSSYDASCLGVYIHGLAGDYMAKKLGSYSLIASDIIDGLPQVLRY